MDPTNPSFLTFANILIQNRLAEISRTEAIPIQDVCRPKRRVLGAVCHLLLDQPDGTQAGRRFPMFDLKKTCTNSVNIFVKWPSRSSHDLVRSDQKDKKQRG